MLWLKAAHLIFVISWFAGLFYLPRIFVNLAMVPASSVAEHQRLLLMARKLYRFMTPIGVIAVLAGLWLWFGYGYTGAWLGTKSVLVALLLAYNLYCGHLLRDFATGNNHKSHVWYRFFNELPALMLIAIVLLVLLKPF